MSTKTVCMYGVDGMSGCGKKDEKICTLSWMFSMMDGQW